MIALLVVVLVAVAALAGGLLVFGIWNEFIVHHLAGASHASLGACILVALAVLLLTNSNGGSGD